MPLPRRAANQALLTALTVEVDRIATATLDGREVALLLSELAGEQRLLLLDLATGSLTGECVRVAAVAESAGAWC
ncbi:hypothetical protein [Streptomyces sp. NPDC056154]|uniref:hypothetical protein n=1 Tax=unclassified Streptomyces TaxID=2593676 RepID=UPI0035DE41E5